MKRIDDKTVALTEEELEQIYNFIRSSLYNDWDRYTDNFISTDSVEVGMRRMDPEMYDFADEINKVMYAN